MREKVKASVSGYNRSNILGKIDAILQSSKNIEIVHRLSDLRNAMNSKAPVVSYEALVNDAKILRYLDLLHEDVLNSNWHVAEIRLESISKTFAERSTIKNDVSNSLAPRKEQKEQKRNQKIVDKIVKQNKLDLLSKELKVDDLFSAEGIYDIQVAKTQDELDKNVELQKSYMERLAKVPNDQALVNKIKSLNNAIFGLNKSLKLYMDESNRASYIETIKSLNDTQKQLIAERPYSREQEKVILETFDQLSRQEEDIVDVHQKNNFGDGGAMGFGGGMPTLQSVGGAYQPSLQSSINKISIDQTAERLAEREQALSRNRQACADDLEDVEAELRPLLAKRANLTPGQRLTSDGDIDILNAKRNRIIKNIELIKQEEAVTLNLRNLIAEKQQRLELAQQNSVLGIGTAGIDFQELAMELREAAEAGNKLLNETGAAVAVAQSVGIDVNSMSGTMQTEVEVIDGYGDDKYAQLEAQLGMSKK